MSSLAQTIAAAAAYALNGTGTYLRERAADAGLDTSTARPAPFIVCGDLTITTLITPVGKEFDSATPTVYFGDSKPGLGDSTPAHDDAVLRMELLQERFFSELLRLDYQASGRRRTEMRDIYAAMLDGLGCQFTLAMPAASYCLPPKPAPVLLPTITNFRALVPLDTPAIANFAALPA